jgi:carbamoyl-phosphate synthase large subunit
MGVEGVRSARAQPSFTILISSAGRRVGLVAAAREALAELDLAGSVLAVDASDQAAAAHVADARFVVPPCDHDTFVPRLLEICRDDAVDLIVPTIDPELPVYASCSSTFAAQGTVIAVSSPETVAICSDKSLTNAWLHEHGFPTVLQVGIEQVRDAGATWTYPCVVKPRRGSASIGVRIVHDAAQLEAAVAGAGHELVVEELAPGNEHTVDVLVDRGGRVVAAVPRRRLEVRAGEVSKAVTVHSPPLEKLARDICEALPGSYGPLNVQVFEDERSGRLSAIEINPRFGGGFPLTWRAGGRYLRWIVEELLGCPPRVAEPWEAGLTMLRYDEAVFVSAQSG